MIYLRIIIAIMAIVFIVVITCCTFKKGKFVKSEENLTKSLLVAVETEDIDKVKELIALGVNIDTRIKYDRTPLMFAAENGNALLVKVLLQSGASPNLQDNFFGRRPLHRAIEKGSLDVIKMLLNSGADANAQDFGMATPLMLAVYYNKPQIVKLLLDNGANPMLEGEYGRTALDWARYYKHPNIITILEKAQQPHP